MYCWARSVLYLVIAVLALGQMMSACGQKGPLYLPDAASEMAPASAPRPDTLGEGRDARDEVPEISPQPDAL